MKRLIFGSILFASTITPFLFSFSTSELFEFNKMLWVYSWTIIIAGLWIARMILEKRLIVKSTPLDLPITLYLISQIISTFISIQPHTSIFGYYSRFHGGLLSTLAYVVWFYAVVSNLNLKQFKLLVITILLSGGLVAWYAIPEEFGRSFSCVAANNQFSTECWSENTNPKYRIFGTFGQPNWLAAYLVTLLPLSLYQLTKSNHSKGNLYLKIGWLFWLISATSAILFTKSRSGFLGLVVAITTFIFSILIVKKKKLNRWLMLSLMTILLIIAIYGSTFTPSINNFLNNNRPTPEPTKTQKVVVSDPGGTDSWQIRKIVWSGAIKVWQRYPLFGSGVETFAYSYYRDRPARHNLVSEWDYLYNKAHNEFLNYLANTGIVGLISYLLILIVASWLTLNEIFSSSKEKKLKERGLLASALMAGIAGLTVTNFFGFSTVTVALIMHLWLAGIVIIKIEEKRLDKSEKLESLENADKKKVEIWQWLLISSIAIGSILGLNIIYKTWQADKKYALSKNLYSLGQVNQAVDLMLEAIKLSPREPVFYNELSKQYAALTQLAIQAKNQKLAKQFEEATVLTSDTALKLNPVNLNFYRNRAQVLASLVQVDEKYVAVVRSTLEKAIKLAPTDAKLLYNLAKVEETDGKLSKAIELYQKAVELKSNYYNAIQAYAKALAQDGQYEKAMRQIEQLESANKTNDELLKLKKEVMTKL